MTDLVSFLRARLDEDERVAQDAAYRRGPDWVVEDPQPQQWGVDQGDTTVLARGKPIVTCDAEYGGGLVDEHIARQDPARVLAEVEAKRRQIERLHHRLEVGTRYTPEPEEYVSCACGWEETLDEHRSALAWDEAYERHLQELSTNSVIADAMLRLLALPHADHPDYRPEWAPSA